MSGWVMSRPADRAAAGARAVAVTALALSLVAACGGSSGSTSPPVQAAPPSTAPTAQEPSISDSGPAPALTPWFVVQLSYPNGYTGTARVTAARLSNMSNAEAFPNVGLGDSCEPDRATTAVVPVDIKLVNTTSSFSFHVEIPIFLPNGVQFEEGFSDGPACESGAFSLGSQLAPGASSDTYGYLFIANYYSPNSPNGDTSLTHGLFTTASYATDSGTDDTVRHVSGIGVHRDYSEAEYPWTMSLPAGDL
jgi:hypothetical protein